MLITDSEFQLIKKYVYELTCNTLGDNKAVMAQNRVAKLLQKMGGRYDISQVLEFVESGYYVEEFINAFTTNKTEFFRESFHFEDLVSRVFPAHFENAKHISIYCSASSTGEEPYSIATSFLHFKESVQNHFLGAKIVATDIDTNALSKAREGVYEHPKNSSMFPPWIKPQKYFKKRELGGAYPHFLIKAKDSLKELIEFKRMNLFEDDYPFAAESFDVIFCRNVLIYFNVEDQNKILKKLFLRLKIGGVLYLGHSESPLGLSPFVKRLGQNIFIKEKGLYGDT